MNTAKGYALYGLAFVVLGALVIGLFVLSLVAPDGQCAVRGHCRLPPDRCRECLRSGMLT